MLEIQDPRPISGLCPGARATGTHAAGKMEAMADDFTATASASASACPAPSRTTDPDFLSCVLQPPTSSSSRPDPDYAALRRLLIRRKPPSALRHRMEWRCNGKGYVAYRNFLLLGIDGGAASSGGHSTPSNSGRWAPSPGPATLSEADSWSSSRDWRSNSGLLGRNISLRSKQSDAERHVRFAEPAYSFVGMHCIFDNCKASVTILKFGHASSDLLAYGASDGSLMVCQVSDPPSVLQKLMGHSKDITVTGSEDSNVYFYDLARPKNSCVNKLQGHSSPVIGVAWSHGENLLASSDSDGTVIVWKRAKAN